MLNIPSWCHPTWQLIHIVAQSIDSSQSYIRFLYHISRIIPCEECAYHMTSYIVHISKSDDMTPLKIADQLHDTVRRRLGQSILSSQAKAEYVERLNGPECYRNFMTVYQSQYQSLEKRHYIRCIDQLCHDISIKFFRYL